MAHTTWRERRRFVSYRHSNRGEFVRGSANSPSMRRETLVCCTKVPRFEGVARDDDDTTDALRSEFDLPSKQTFASTTHIHIESLLSRFVRVYACTRLNPPLLFSPQGRGNRIISGCMVRRRRSPPILSGGEQTEVACLSIKTRSGSRGLVNFPQLFPPPRGFIHIYLLIGG